MNNYKETKSASNKIKKNISLKPDPILQDTKVKIDLILFKKDTYKRKIWDKNHGEKKL